MTGLIVHEWVEKSGGAEKVVQQFVKAFPEADLQVLWSDVPEQFGETNVYETWLAQTPLRQMKAVALPFLPLVWRNIRARQSYDWILTSSHLFAHHVQLRGAASTVPKYSYVHTPARYIWEPELDHRGASIGVRAASAILKPLDKKRAQESVRVAANSEFTRQRIQRVWDRDADVIYPPVNTERIIAGGDWRDRLPECERMELESLPQTFLLGASRFVPYKGLNLVIDAGEATGLPVVIAGRGPHEAQLRARAAEANVPVTFVISPSDALLFALYQRCEALIFPAVEDFGIVPVEAMAAGTPVVVPTQGGASESVSLMAGGTAVEGFVASEWRRALEAVQNVDRQGLPGRTERFSETNFRAAISEWVADSPNTLGTQLPLLPQKRGF